MKKIKIVAATLVAVSTVLVTGVCMPLIAHADTEIAADITQNTEWTKAQSPYVIEKQLVIEKGSTLTIKPGTIIKFKVNTGFHVGGVLDAEGSNKEKIQFIPYEGSDTSYPWGMFFDNSASSTLDNVVVTNTGQGIYALGSQLSMGNLEYASSSRGIWFDGSNGVLNHVTIHDSSGYPLSVYNKSVVSIDSSSLYSISGIAVAVYNSSSLDASNIDIHGVPSGNAMAVYSGSQTSCTDCVFDSVGTNKGLDGITIYNNSRLNLEHVIVTKSGANASLDVYDTETDGVSKLLLTDSTVDSCQGDGILLYSQAEAQIGNSHISNCTRSGILAYQNPQISISSTTIETNAKGMELYGGVTGFIASSTLEHNAGYGLFSQTAEPFNAINNNWGSLTGPYHETKNTEGKGDRVSDNVSFSPWITDLPPKTTECCSNVLFIPGIESSRLYTQGILFENQLWEPNRNADVEKLYMSTAGTSLTSAIYTRDLLDTSNIVPGFGPDIYAHFMKSLDMLVQNKTINSWQAMPYDWRYDVRDVVSNGVAFQYGIQNIVATIEALATQSQTKKVTLVTHSNGGLVAKEIINELIKEKKDSLIDSLIMVAAPQLGTPKALATLLHGYGQELGGGLILKEQTARSLAENMPAAYGLLPSRKYISSGSEPLILFDDSLKAMSNFNALYGSAITTYDKMANFLIAKNNSRAKPELGDVIDPNILNSTLLKKADELHTSQDNQIIPSAIKVVQIAGTGIETLRGIEYADKQSFLCLLSVCKTKDTLDIEPLLTTQGDETVVEKSATALPVDTYYIDLAAYNRATNQNRKHSDIMETDSVMSLVGNLLAGNDKIPSYVSKTDLALPANGINVSIHSPVSLDLYDAAGNHTGQTSDSNPDSPWVKYEEKIPNSYYMPFGEGVYAGVSDSSATVSLKGEGVGTFSLDITAGTSSIHYQDIPVLPETTAKINIDPANLSQGVLKIDMNGDGIDDMSISPHDDLDPVSYLEAIKKIILDSNLKQTAKDALIKRIDKITVRLKNGKISKSEKIIKKLSKVLISKKRYHGKINDEDRTAVLSMIDQLLTNLEAQ